MRVTDHVYVLSGGCYAAVDNRAVLGEVYGVRTPKGMILIDCGAPRTGLAAIQESLDYYGIDDPITYVMLTHGHWDHCGSASAFKRAGARIVVGKEDVTACVNGGNRNPASPLFDKGHAYPSFMPDVGIERDCMMEADGIPFEFIKTPGHSAGSVAIKLVIDGKTILFTGDSLQPEGRMLSEVAFGWEGDVTFSREDLVKSMQKLSRHETDIILPGHGRICLKNGTKMLQLAAEEAEKRFLD